MVGFMSGAQEGGRTLRPPGLTVFQRHGDGCAGRADLRLWGLRRQLFPQLCGDLLTRDGQVRTRPRHLGWLNLGVNG